MQHMTIRLLRQQARGTSMSMAWLGLMLVIPLISACMNQDDQVSISKNGDVKFESKIEIPDKSREFGPADVAKFAEESANGLRQRGWTVNWRWISQTRPYKLTFVGLGNLSKVSGNSEFYSLRRIDASEFQLDFPKSEVHFSRKVSFTGDAQVYDLKGAVVRQIDNVRGETYAIRLDSGAPSHLANIKSQKGNWSLNCTTDKFTDQSNCNIVSSVNDDRGEKREIRIYFERLNSISKRPSDQWFVAYSKPAMTIVIVKARVDRNPVVEGASDSMGGFGAFYESASCFDVKPPRTEAEKTALVFSPCPAARGKIGALGLISQMRSGSQLLLGVSTRGSMATATFPLAGFAETFEAYLKQQNLTFGASTTTGSPVSAPYGQKPSRSKGGSQKEPASSAPKQIAALPSQKIPGRGVQSVVPGGTVSQFRHGTLVTKKPDGALIAADDFDRATHIHPGIDIAAPEGSPIYSAADGTVIDTITETNDRDYPSLGFAVFLRHRTDFAGKPTYGAYFHLAHPTNLVRGDKVVKGRTVIGMVGNTGVTHGFHTHFETRHFESRYFENDMWNKPWNIYGRFPQATALLQKNWSDPLVFLGK